MLIIIEEKYIHSSFNCMWFSTELQITGFATCVV